MEKMLLHENWKLREVSEAGCFPGTDWIPGTVPGSVYQDYLNAGKMEDPYWRANEEQALELMKRDFEYRTAFDVTEGMLSHDEVILHFDGIDTVADICLNGQTLFFTIVGIAYFVSSEISLTMGIAPILLVLFGVSFYASTGLTLDDQWISSGRAGAYIGYTMILLYTGRTYYSSVFKRAFTIRRRKSSDDFTNEAGQLDASIVAARLFVISTAAFMYVLTIMGCSWPMSIFFSLALLIMMLVISRVISETGVPFLQSGWSPAEIIAAVGRNPKLICSVLPFPVKAPLTISVFCASFSSDPVSTPFTAASILAKSVLKSVRRKSSVASHWWRP